MSTAKERPIRFNPDMARAVRRAENPKTQTRRVMRPQPAFEPGRPNFWSWEDCQWADGGLGFPESGIIDHSPFGIPGDRLFVQEEFCRKCQKSCYPEDGKKALCEDYRIESPKLMTRRDSRTILEITAVGVQQLQDISFKDAEAEGIYDDYHGMHSEARNIFAEYWDTIARESETWLSNPWVWVYAFRRVEE